MSKNIFFEQKGPFWLSEIFKSINLKKKIKIFDIKPLNEAKNSNVTSILFCGFDGGLGKKIADYAIHFPINNYGITEDLHQMTMHTIAQYLRMKNMRPEDIESKKF